MNVYFFTYIYICICMHMYVCMHLHIYTLDSRVVIDCLDARHFWHGIWSSLLIVSAYVEFVTHRLDVRGFRDSLYSHAWRS